MDALNGMLVGAFMVGCLVAGLFFLRFWRSTRDRFFLFFAIAFLIEGVHRVVIFEVVGPEASPVHYLPRLLAYGLIIAAIVDKNRKARPLPPKE